MNIKQKENILKYISDFLRTFGGAMMFVALSAIVFSKADARFVSSRYCKFCYSWFFYVVNWFMVRLR